MGATVKWGQNIKIPTILINTKYIFLPVFETREPG